MEHLNLYLPCKVAGVDFCFVIALRVWQRVSVFCKMEAVETDAPQLTTLAVVTDSTGVFRRSLNVKNITSDDQVTLMVNQNAATMTQSFEIYVYEIATDARTAHY